MAKTTQTVVIVDENGEENDLDRSQFISFFVDTQELPGLPSVDENDNVIEGEEAHSPSDTANMLLQLYDDPSSQMDWSEAPFDRFERYYNWMDETLAESEVILKKRAESAKADKEKAKADKEREKAEAEEQKALLESNQNAFINAARKGQEAAGGAFEKQLKSFGDTFPDGVAISQDGLGLVFAEGSLNPETLGSTVGALSGAETNFEALTGIIAFLMGDAMNAALEQGLYKSGIIAGKALSEEFAKIGINKNPRLFERYGRMSREIPLSLRNKDVEPYAYLQVVEAAAPKKAPEEKTSEYQERKDKHSEDKKKLYQALHDGKIEVPSKDGGESKTLEVKDTSSVKPLIEKLQVKHGVKKIVDKNKKTAAEMLLEFFWCSRVLDLFDNFAQKEGDSVIFLIKGEKFLMSRSDIVTLRESVQAELENIHFNVSASKSDSYSLAQMLEGTRTVQRVTMDTSGDTAKPKKDSEGNTVYHDESVDTYPPLLVRPAHATKLEEPEAEKEPEDPSTEEESVV